MKVKFEGIEIEGDKRFINHTKKALRLLKNKAPYYYKLFVYKFIRRIKLYRLSGVCLDSIFLVSKKTAFPGLRWYASNIVHESCHLWRNARGLKPGGTKAELECIRVQIKVGLLIGLSKQNIKYLKSLDGTHWKLPRTW